MKFFKQRLRNNYKTIIGVSSLAFLLWFMVKMSLNYDYTMDVPLHFVNMNPQMTFKYPQAGKVTIEFIGTGLDLLRLPFYQVDFQIDLSDAPGHLEIDPSEKIEYVKFPADLDIAVKSIIKPRIIKLDLDKKVEKLLPVLPPSEEAISTEPGYIFVDSTVEPDSISVTGPAEMFSDITHMQLEKKYYEVVKRAFSDELKVLKIPDYYSEYYPQTVDVYYNVQRLTSAEFGDVPVEVINVPDNYQVIPLPSNATIYSRGGEKILADVRSSDFKIEIDFLKEWKPGSKKVKANIISEVDLLYVESRPSEFELVVQKK